MFLMKVSKKKFIRISAISIVGLLGFLTFIFLGTLNSGKDSQDPKPEIINGKQVINLSATISGYSPSIINANANTDTILKVSTKNSFGCVNNLTIPKLNVYENLDPTGLKEINIGSRAPGEVIEGLCSGGINSFIIKFS